MTPIKNIFFSVFTNIWILAVNVGLNFIAPYFISVEDFGLFRKFMLYISFTGIMHLGFIDGIYLFFAGKGLINIERSIFNKYRLFFIVFQLVICFCFFIVGIILNNPILYYFAVAALFINVYNYGNYFYQSINEFKIFSLVNFLVNLILGLCIFFIFFVLKLKDYHYLIYSIILSYFFGSVLYEFFYHKHIKLEEERSLDLSIKVQIKNMFFLGGFILMGNLLFLYVINSDKWIVNFFFPTKMFAYYAFSGSIVGIVISLITSVSMALYPTLVAAYTLKNISYLKIITLIFSVLGLMTYFIAFIFIHLFFKKYVDSIEILRYMVLGLPAISLIAVICVNYYKINSLGKRYVLDLLVVALISISLNIMVFYIFRSMVLISLASVVSLYFALWYFSRKNDFLNFTIQDIVYCGVNLVVFLLLLSSGMNIYLSFTAYMFSSLSLSFIFYRVELGYFFNKIKLKK